MSDETSVVPGPRRRRARAIALPLTVGLAAAGAAWAAWSTRPAPPPARPAPPRPPEIPRDAELASARLRSVGSSLGPAYDVTLTRPADVAALTGWLRRVDWSSPRAYSLSGVGLTRVGKITLAAKDGSARTYELSGGIVVVDGWAWPADTGELAAIARRAGADVP